MNVSRDDGQPGTTGLWPRVRSSLASARNRFLRGRTPADASGNGSGSEDPLATDSREADDGRERTVRSAERILTPREQVIEVVTANGGRMKQAEIVSRMDWSESTVSRKLSELEANDAITRYRIGREKLVYLPGAEPEGLKSPLARADAEQPSRA